MKCFFPSAQSRQGGYQTYKDGWGVCFESLHTIVQNCTKVDIDKQRLSRMIRFIEKDLGLAEGDLNEIGQLVADTTKLVCTEMLLNELRNPV